MDFLFYLAAAVAIVSTLLMLTRLHAVHALLYLILSLLAVAVIFFLMGAAFVAALEVVIYAGAIMVLFVFVVMLLNLGARATAIERTWLRPGMWIGPAILAAILVLELSYLLFRGKPPPSGAHVVEPKQVGIALFGPYVIGAELASFLLMAALVGAYHLGRRRQAKVEHAGSPRGKLETDNDTYSSEPGAAVGSDLVRAGTDRTARAS
jgi:NADH-quinone oxidoreductase subunit J